MAQYLKTQFQSPSAKRPPAVWHRRIDGACTFIADQLVGIRRYQRLVYRAHGGIIGIAVCCACQSIGSAVEYGGRK